MHEDEVPGPGVRDLDQRVQSFGIADDGFLEIAE